MGRPRKVFSNFRVVVPVDRGLWESLREAARKEDTSVTGLARSLFQSFLCEPAYHLVYMDPLVFENVANPGSYTPARRECLGWLESADMNHVRIVWDRAVDSIPGGKEPAGCNGLVLPRSCVVDLKRTTSP